MNKTVLITGASSGIGFELSKIFARKGYNLIMVSRNKERLEKAKNIVYMENEEVNIEVLAKDLSEPSAPDEIYDYTQKNSIQVDILVNNAGVQVYGNFHHRSIQDTLDMMNINMFALTKLTRLYIEDMVKKGEGKILNIGSTGSFQPVPLNSVYCASKAFVLYLSEGIREELRGTGVTVTTLCPGATKTNFARRANIEDIKLFRGTLLQPSYVARVGYEALMKNKSVVTVGLFNKLMAQSIRLMPRFLVTKVGMNMMKR